jgi:hypothetical protein
MKTLHAFRRGEGHLRPLEVEKTSNPNAPHTIYGELWHLAFWQQITLDWIAGIETPYPNQPFDGFAKKPSTEAKEESWQELRHRFLDGAEQAAAAAMETHRLGHPIRCSSRPGFPARMMSVRDQLISLAAHNAYHLGRIVLLRQLLHAWPHPLAALPGRG